MSRLTPRVATTGSWGACRGDLLGEGTGGVVEIEIFAVEAEQEDERGADGDEGVGANVGDTQAADAEADGERGERGR